MSALLKTFLVSGAGRSLRHRSILLGSFLACALVLLVAVSAAASANAAGNGKSIMMLNPGERVAVAGKDCTPFIRRRSERKIRIECLFGAPRPTKPPTAATAVPDTDSYIQLVLGDTLVLKRTDCNLRVKDASDSVFVVVCKPLLRGSPIIVYPN
jgi:hypothetical protein